MKTRLFLIPIYLLSVALFSCSDPLDKIAPGISSIKSTDLIETVSQLSDKEYEGRMSGSKAYDKAAAYMANKFEDIGMQPGINSSFMQHLNVEYNEIHSPCLLNLVKDNTVVKKYELGKDYVYRGFTGSGNFTAPVAFCGYGISRPDLGYDDYAGIDVKGKVVMVFKYNPSWQIGDNRWHHNYPREKSFTAAQHGAIGILFVSIPNVPEVQKTIGSILAGEGEQNESFPQMHIDLPVAADLLEGSGFSLSQLQTTIDDNKKPKSILVNASVQVEVHAEYTKEKQTENVVAMMEGSDPALKDQYLVIGAHLDHVGIQGDDVYFPGANDNASGSAAVLEIAKAFKESGVKPKRSIIFVLFAGEELGLNGARYFVENSPVPHEKIVAMLNMDCIAHGDSIRIGGGGKSPRLWNITREKDSLLSNMMVEGTWPGGGADATPFFEQNIPTLYFVTTNSYTHLHYMTDTPETLNPDLYEKIVRLAYATAYEVAMGNYEKEVIDN